MSFIKSLNYFIVACVVVAFAFGANAGAKNYYKLGNAYRVGGNWYTPVENFKYSESGKVSWYGDKFHGKPTASGESFNKNGFSAAHKTLPLPTIARVTNLDNGQSVIVRINDRGPFSNDRILDVSKAAAVKLGFEKAGVAKAKVVVLEKESVAAQKAAKKGIISSVFAPKTIEKKVVEPIKTEVRPEKESKPLVKTNKNTVQVGAFQIKENAEKLVRKLVSYGNAAVKKTKDLYHVHFPTKTTEQAETLKETLKGKGYTDTFIKK